MASKPKRNAFPSDWNKRADRIKLNEALESGDSDTVKKWLNAGMDPNMTGGWNSPLLYVALMHWKWTHGSRLLDLLLERGADPNLGEPPPLFQYYSGFRLSWLLNAGADPGKTWTRPKESRPFRIETFVKEEGLEDFADVWKRNFNTLKFWRLKKAARPRPEFTKAFAMFAVRRAGRLIASTEDSLSDIFGLSKKQVKESEVFQEAVAVWLDKNFDTIDHLSPDSKTSLILRFRRSDEAWLDFSVRIELEMGESLELTLEAFRAEKLRSELDRSIKRPVATGGRRPGRGIL